MDIDKQENLVRRIVAAYAHWGWGTSATSYEEMPQYILSRPHVQAAFDALTPVPANPELDEAVYGAVTDRVVEDFSAKLGAANRQWLGTDEELIAGRPSGLSIQREPLYDKLVAPQGRKQVTIFVPERGIDGKTIRPLVVEKELNQVFGWYLATHGVRGSADSAKTPVTAFTVAVADDLGVRDAVGIAGRAAALTGAPVTVTLDTGNMVKVDALGQFV